MNEKENLYRLSARKAGNWIAGNKPASAHAATPTSQTRAIDDMPRCLAFRCDESGGDHIQGCGRMTRQPNISQIINSLADKHDINITKLRDVIEDLRRIVFRKSREAHGEKVFRGCEGIDVYMCLSGKRYPWTTRLSGGSRKPVCKPAKRRAGK